MTHLRTANYELSTLLKQTSFTRLLQLFFIALLLMVQNLAAQNPFIQQYTTFDGLPSNKIICMIQDNQKFLWIGTDGGLVRYDGSTFTRYGVREGLDNPKVLNIKEDSFGRVWLACSMMKMNYFYHNKIHNIQNTPFLASLGGTPIITQDRDRCLYFYNYYGRQLLVLDTNNQIARYVMPSVPLKSDSLYYEGMAIWYITKTSSGDYLIWTQLGLFKTKTLGEKPVLISSSKPYHNIKPIGDDVMYYVVMDPVTQTSMYIKYKDGLPVDSTEFPVKSRDDNGWIAEDPNGGLWISRFDVGLFYLRDKKIIYHLDEKETGQIVRDHEGNIWMGSKKGLFKISPYILDFKHYDNSYFQGEIIDGLSSNPDGGVWCIAGGKAFLYQNNEFYFQDLNRLRVGLNKIYGLNNNSVIVGKEYYYNFILTGTTTVPSGKKLQFEKISRFPVDGSLAINNKKTEIGIYNYSKGEITLYSPQNNFQETSRASVGRPRWMFYNAKNNLVVSGVGNHYILKNNMMIPCDELKSFSGKALLIHCGLNPETDLYYTSDDSIYLVHENRVFNLSSSLLYSLDSPIQRIIYHEPTLYLSTMRNIYTCTNPLDLLKNKDVQLRLLDINFKDVRDIMVQNDSLYIASSDGLTIIPEAMISKIRQQVPVPYFKSIMINNAESDPFLKDTTVQGKAKMDFLFGSVNYSHNPVWYSYMLDGYDNDWTTGTSGSVIYSNLPPGNYSFKLRASMPNAPWSEPIQYHFRVKASFWQHPLFFVFLAIIITGMISLIIIRRKNIQIKRRELDHQLIILEQQALQSMMNPHFIFNSLSSIQSYLLQKKSGEAGLYLSQFARLIRQNLNSINAASINLEEEIDRLKNYLDLEKLRMENKFDYNIDLAENVEADEMEIPSMIIQPFVENAIWHGIAFIEEKGQIQIKFLMQDDKSLLVIVEDNGIGMKRSEDYSAKREKHHHLGMEMTRKRLEILGRKFSVKTFLNFSEMFPGTPNPGTRVELVVPVGI